jgi:hypothetical protein
MANTFNLISSYTVPSGGMSAIDFANIPQNYTDLKVMASLRTQGNQVWGYFTFNNTQTGFSNRSAFGVGSGAGQSGQDTTSTGYRYTLWADGNNQTANTFGSTEIYIPNYAGSTRKSASVQSITENNATAVYTFVLSVLWANTDPITSIQLVPWNSADEPWAQNSSFYLYGIKNS